MQASEQSTQLDSNQRLTTTADADRAISGTRHSPSLAPPGSTNPSQGFSEAQPGGSPSPSPSYGWGMKQSQDPTWEGACASPSLSVGQRMKKSQASWLPQPLSACPLTTSAPSSAAYAMPQQAKRAAITKVHGTVLHEQCPPQANSRVVSRPSSGTTVSCLHSTRAVTQAPSTLDICCSQLCLCSACAAVSCKPLS